MPTGPDSKIKKGSFRPVDLSAVDREKFSFGANEPRDAAERQLAGSIAWGNDAPSPELLKLIVASLGPVESAPPMDAPLPEAEVDSLHQDPPTLEIEQAVLGALMFDNRLYDSLRDFLSWKQFSVPLHQRLFTAMMDTISNGRLAEPTFLVEKFRNDPAFVEWGGLAYLADLVDRAPPAQTALNLAIDLLPPKHRSPTGAYRLKRRMQVAPKPHWKLQR